MSKFKLTQTATEVQNILNNSLQKPTGLSKTKLVGVGVNGQENIEIGDNLTLANGKLSAATGSGVNGLESDAEGNLTASKDLKVDGKLKLKSLVSASNPDGDITKELGSGGSIQLYHHHIYLFYEHASDRGYIYFDYDSTNAEQFTVDTLVAAMQGKTVICSGYLIISSKRIVVNITGIYNKLQVRFYDETGTIPSIPNGLNIDKSDIQIQDNVYAID